MSAVAVQLPLYGALTSASAAICYGGLREEQTKARAEGRLVGIGIATYAELTGIGSRISAAPGMPINTGTESATIRLAILVQEPF